MKSEVTKEVWKSPSDIPSGKAFNTTFGVKQESIFKGGSKAKAYAMVVAKTRFNTTKHHHDVWNYIKDCNVYVKPDRYKRNNVASPGILFQVHPMLVWKKDLLIEIKNALSECKMPSTDDCNTWIQENHPNHKQEDKTPDPDFNFTTYVAKWGNSNGRVEATVLKFWCAEKDGVYLKSLMSHAWAKTNLRGQFVPTKAWLVTSRDV
eukprot:14558748-Ditylum_brightwellii.AAC.1